MTSMSMIPQVSLPIFGAIRVIEESLCSMSMVIWDIDNVFAPCPWKLGTSTTRHLYGLQQDFWSGIHEFRAYEQQGSRDRRLASTHRQ